MDDEPYTGAALPFQTLAKFNCKVPLIVEVTLFEVRFPFNANVLPASTRIELVIAIALRVKVELLLTLKLKIVNPLLFICCATPPLKVIVLFLPLKAFVEGRLKFPPMVKL